jgi:hypothetical protein
MLGWPATPFGLGWFGHTQAGCLGVVESPPVAHEVVRPPLGPNGNLSIWPKGWLNHPQWPKGWFGHPLPIAQNFFFRLAQGVVWPPWANRSKFLFWAFGPRGGSAAPWAIGGGSAAPRPADLGVAKPPQAKWGGRPPPIGWFDHTSIFF